MNSDRAEQVIGPELVACARAAVATWPPLTADEIAVVISVLRLADPLPQGLDTDAA